MSSTGENIKSITGKLPQGVKLVAVSKFNPPERILDAYAAGQRAFGESRVQELLTKFDVLPSDIEWHFIGHLQTNKVKQIVGRVSMIESVDSEKLLAFIDKESAARGVVTDVLLQLHVAAEETKFGFLPAELETLMATEPWLRYPNVRLRGIMGMATNTDDQARIRADFRTIRSCFDELDIRYPQLTAFNTVSMGMSGDWPVAVDEGSTSVRIGSAIFGARMYADK